MEIENSTGNGRVFCTNRIINEQDENTSAVAHSGHMVQVAIPGGKYCRLCR